MQIMQLSDQGKIAVALRNNDRCREDQPHPSPPRIGEGLTLLMVSTKSVSALSMPSADRGGKSPFSWCQRIGVSSFDAVRGSGREITLLMVSTNRCQLFRCPPQSGEGLGGVFLIVIKCTDRLADTAGNLAAIMLA